MYFFFVDLVRTYIDGGAESTETSSLGNDSEDHGLARAGQSLTWVALEARVDGEATLPEALDDGSWVDVDRGILVKRNRGVDVIVLFLDGGGGRGRFFFDDGI